MKSVFNSSIVAGICYYFVIIFNLPLVSGMQSKENRVGTKDRHDATFFETTILEKKTGSRLTVFTINDVTHSPY